MKLDAIRAYTFSDYQWDDKEKFYRYPNGNRVSDRDLLRAIRRRNKKFLESLNSLFTHLQNGDISIEDWQRRFANKLQDEHYTLLEFGRGGKKRTTQKDYKDTEDYLRSVEYPAISRFAADLIEGTNTEQQARARLKLYAYHTKVAYERGRLEAKSQIHEQGRRRLGITDRHCNECLYYASLGWQDLRSIVLPGDRCTCGAMCKCSIETK